MKILFVCLGNICRSPMAEAVLLHKLEEAQLDIFVDVDSAGLGDWHVGEWPDPRTIATLQKRGIAPASRARQIQNADFEEFDLIIGMDQANIAGLQRFRLDRPGQIALCRAWSDGSTLEVPDPYYGEMSDFEHVFELVDAACDGIVAQIRSA